jgi:cell division protease FtsH
MKKRPFELSKAILLIGLYGFLVLLLSDLAFFNTRAREIPYSDFQTLLRADQVDNLEISPTQIDGTIRSPEVLARLPEADASALRRQGAPYRFSTVRIADDTLAAQLKATNVRYTGVAERAWPIGLLGWMLPLLAFYLFGRYAFKGVGGLKDLSGVGKSGASLYEQQQSSVTFDDIAGIDEAKAELQQIVQFLRRPERYRRLGGKIPKGVLIVGAPGTGKTLLAKAVAGEAKVPFLSISGSAFVEMFVGVGAARVRDLFERAKQLAPCIVFIDELDALGKVRGASVIAGNDEREQTLNQLLVEMDGFEPNSGVILLAATNRPEILDPALLRPGRYDRHIAIEVTLADDVDLAELAARTPGFAGADLANVVNEATLHAAELEKAAVDMADFDEAIDRAMAGMQRKSRVMNEREKLTIAYHEAGHALVALSRPHCDPVKKVSIIPRGVAALGYTQQVPTEDRYVLRESELLDRLDAALGGRVAEEIMFADVSTGAQNDLDQATALARHMIVRCGMSPALGLATFSDDEALSGPGAMPRHPMRYSDRTAELIDAEVRRMLAEAHERVRRTLRDEKPLLEKLARLLLAREVVDHETLRQLMESDASQQANGEHARQQMALQAQTPNAPIHTSG